MTNDQLANKIYAESYNCCCLDGEHEEKAITVEDVIQPLANFLDSIFFNFNREEFIKRCKGEI